MNRPPPATQAARRLALLAAACLLFTTPAPAAPVTLHFEGIVTNLFGIGFGSDFAPFHSATTLSGRVTFHGDTPDALPGDPGRGRFDDVLLDLEIHVPGIGQWSSINNGWINTWDNTPCMFDDGDAVWFVGGKTDFRAGPRFGNNFFVGAQVSLLGNTPAAAPDMLLSDYLPTSMLGWEKGHLWLGYMDEDFQPTTVRLDFLIPEPSSFALALLGGGALVMARRRRSKSSTENRSST